MSEYQRYEFMTIDRPLTKAQLDAVNNLSSHIKASATQALIEYHWGDFKHNPIDVLYKFFDGFLYWANWGSPHLAFRFPHGTLAGDLIDGYDLDDFITFTQHADYDILDIHFGEMEGPDEWIEYTLGSLIAIRDELLEGDLRALYIAWLAGQIAIEGYDEGEDEDNDDAEDGDENEDEDWEINVPPVPPAFGKLTTAQQELAQLLQVPSELLNVAGQHSNTVKPAATDNFDAWLDLLPAARRHDYLLRLAHNEPGLSRLLVKELRALGQDKAATTEEGERVPYATLLAESKAVNARMKRERQTQEQLARQRHLQAIHDRQKDYWRQVDVAVGRKISAGYDDALSMLIELRDAADHFKETQEFQARFHAWVRPYRRLSSFIKRLQDHDFSMPDA